MISSPPRIWLSPACSHRDWPDGDELFICDTCGAPSVEYIRADLVETMKEEG